MELVYGIIWGIYTLYSSSLSPLSLRAQPISNPGTRVYIHGGHSMHSTENRRVNTRGHPVVSAPVVLEREGTSRHRAAANVLSILSHPIVSPDYRRRYLIAMVDVLLAFVVTSKRFGTHSAHFVDPYFCIGIDGSSIGFEVRLIAAAFRPSALRPLKYRRG